MNSKMNSTKKNFEKTLLGGTRSTDLNNFFSTAGLQQESSPFFEQFGIFREYTLLNENDFYAKQPETIQSSVGFWKDSTANLSRRFSKGAEVHCVSLHWHSALICTY